MSARTLWRDHLPPPPRKHSAQTIWTFMWTKMRRSSPYTCTQGRPHVVPTRGINLTHCRIYRTITGHVTSPRACQPSLQAGVAKSHDGFKSREGPTLYFFQIRQFHTTQTSLGLRSCSISLGAQCLYLFFEENHWTWRRKIRVDPLSRVAHHDISRSRYD